MNFFLAEVKHWLRSPMDVINPVLFALLVCLMFPIGVGPAPATLAKFSPGLIWIVVLLSCLLASDKLFQRDFDDGSLALWLLSPKSSYGLAMLKVFSHWLGSGLMMTLVAPLLALLLNLPLHSLSTLMFSVGLGSLSLIYIGAIGSALTVGLKQGSILLSLIILPLYIPVLILGVASVQAAAIQMPVQSYLLMMMALALLVIALSPLAIVAGLKINLEAK